MRPRIPRREGPGHWPYQYVLESYRSEMFDHAMNCAQMLWTLRGREQGIERGNPDGFAEEPSTVGDPAPSFIRSRITLPIVTK